MFRTGSFRSWMTAAVVCLSEVPAVLADSFGVTTSGNFSARVQTGAPDPLSFPTDPNATRNYMSNPDGVFVMFGLGISGVSAGNSRGGNSAVGGLGGSYMPIGPTGIANGPGVVNGNGENGLAHQLAGTPTPLPPAWGLWGSNPGAASGLGVETSAIPPVISGILGAGSIGSVGGSNSSGSPTVSSDNPASLQHGTGLTQNPVVVNPEPSSILLFGTGLLGVALWRYRSNRQG